MRTFSFETLNLVPPVTPIFNKRNNCEILCLVCINFQACSILLGYSLLLRSVNQQQRKLVLQVLYSKIGVCALAIKGMN